jgi:hypothetical protein
VIALRVLLLACLASAMLAGCYVGITGPPDPFTPDGAVIQASVDWPYPYPGSKIHERATRLGWRRRAARRAAEGSMAGTRLVTITSVANSTKTDAVKFIGKRA